MKMKKSVKWLKRAAVLSVAAFALSSAMGEIVPWVFEEEKTVRTEAASGIVTAADGTTSVLDTWSIFSSEGMGEFAFLYPGLLLFFR